MRGLLPRTTASEKGAGEVLPLLAGLRPFPVSPPPRRSQVARPAVFRFIGRVTKETTQGISIEVESYFVPEQSDAVLDRYVFAYRIRIANQSMTASAA